MGRRNPKGCEGPHPAHLCRSELLLRLQGRILRATRKRAALVFGPSIRRVGHHASVPRRGPTYFCARRSFVALSPPLMTYNSGIGRSTPSMNSGRACHGVALSTFARSIQYSSRFGVRPHVI